MIHDRTCPECGATFSPLHGSQVCCSDECKRSRVLKMKKSYNDQRRGPLMPHKCIICGKEFLSRGTRRKTCSHECSYEHYLRASRHSADCYVGGEATKRVMQQACRARQKREKARRIRLARLDLLAPKPKIEIITRDGIVIERRGTVPLGCHAVGVIKHT